MASTFPGRFSRHLLSSSTFSSSSSFHHLPLLLFPFRSLTTITTTAAHVAFNLEPEGGREGPDAADSNPQQRAQQQRLYFERLLENGLDQGFYRAIVVGKVGQKPVQKRLKSGRLVTLFAVGTGGMRNNRWPLDDEEPLEIANRCAVQWHRVSVYPERLALLAMKNVKPGSIIYVEGNLETKVFGDPISGFVRHVREIAIRQDGRFVLLGKGSDEQDQADLRGVGYF